MTQRLREKWEGIDAKDVKLMTEPSEGLGLGLGIEQLKLTRTQEGCSCSAC